MAIPRLRPERACAGALSVGGRRRHSRSSVQNDWSPGPPARCVAAAVPAVMPPPADAALIVYFHGGGWVLGDLDTHDAPCRALARATGATVISVDYRLAPEHPFPAPVDDAFAAFCDVVPAGRRVRRRPGADHRRRRQRGGHLAASVAQRAVERGRHAPAAQVLIYPVSDFTQTYPSELAFAEGLLLTKADMDWFTGHFLVRMTIAARVADLRADSTACRQRSS